MRRTLVTTGLLAMLVAVAISDAVSGAPGKADYVGRGTPVSVSTLPDPTECTVKPRTPAELRALAPGGQRRRYRPRRPRVVDATLVAEVTASTRIYVACLNTGDDYRVYGILTHNYIRTIPSGDGYLVDNQLQLESKATPSAIRWSQLYPMPSVLEVTALDDGRVATDLVFAWPERERRTTLVWIELGGHWLIDEEVESVDQELTPRDIEDFQA